MADKESQMTDEMRREKRKKLIMYIIAFIIFQTIVIVVMSFTVMKIRTPQYRVRSAEFSKIPGGNNSFNTMNARLRVKNMNFGTFKYDDSTITFFYHGMEVGTAAVPNSKVGWLSSKKFNVEVPLSSSIQSNSNWTTDVNAGVLPLTAQSKLSGKVTLTFIFKKKKSTNMDCSFQLNPNTQEIQEMKC